jgi:hypothetical protein
MPACQFLPPGDRRRPVFLRLTLSFLHAFGPFAAVPRSLPSPARYLALDASTSDAFPLASYFALLIPLKDIL